MANASRPNWPANRGLTVDYPLHLHPSFLKELGKALDDLVGILRIHPMLERSVREYLAGADVAWNEFEELERNEVVRRVRHRGESFYTLQLQR